MYNEFIYFNTFSASIAYINSTCSYFRLKSARVAGPLQAETRRTMSLAVCAVSEFTRRKQSYLSQRPSPHFPLVNLHFTHSNMFAIIIIVVIIVVVIELNMSKFVKDSICKLY